MNIRSITYSVIHPIRFYSELWENKRCPFAASFGVLFAFFIAKILERQTTGFAFNYNKLEDFNVVVIFLQVFGMALLWAITNWGVSTLFDGKARTKQIWTYSSFALLPYTMSLYILVILSNIFVPDEGIFLQWIVYLGIFWSLCMLLVALMIIHDYGFGKAIWSGLLSVLGILVILFLAVLVFSLFQQIYGFIQDIVSEIVYIVVYERG